MLFLQIIYIYTQMIFVLSLSVLTVCTRYTAFAHCFTLTYVLTRKLAITLYYHSDTQQNKTKQEEQNRYYEY